MKQHWSMNRVYRLVWSRVKCAWVVVVETVRGRNKKAPRKIATAVLFLSAAWVQAGPSGGQVVSGAGSISQSGNTTTIQQSSQQLSLTWKGFDIAPQEAVNFKQPSAAAIAVNRIYDTNGTQIHGRLNANGQVFLINPNGILFGQGARVDVGGLVASTLDINDASLGSNTRNFSGNGEGSIINRGSLHAADGGYIALLGNTVSNQGVISAKLGTVALGAGSAVTLTFDGNSLVNMQVDQSTLDNLTENKQLIRADGGQVLVTAGAMDTLLASVVNNTGIIEARTVENHDGVITLLSGMQAGKVNVGGALDAGAPEGGTGGIIETSAARVTVADDAVVSTLAPQGNNGAWLIDPSDFTIAGAGGDMTGAAVGAALAGGNVIIQSAAGAEGANGDINVNDSVSWNANTLTLNAQNNIVINSEMNGSGTAGLALEYGQAAVAFGNTAEYMVNAPVNLASTGSFSTKLGSNGATVDYTIITELGAEGSTTSTDLQGINGDLEGSYVLGADIDAANTVSWNGGEGFTPIGNSFFFTRFTGIFDGLGHTLSGLTINRPTTENVGLFGYISSASIRNVGLVGGSVNGQYNVGGLVGFSEFSTISNSYTTGSVSGSGTVGGLVGLSESSIVNNSYTTGSVSGSGTVGGLVGFSNFSTVSNSYTMGNVSGSITVGGLVGFNSFFSPISNSYATGSVSGQDYVGGLVGINYVFSPISNSYATGNVGGNFFVGGLVGFNFSPVSNSYSTGSVSGQHYVGGLLGGNDGTVENSYWDTETSGQSSSAGGTGITTAQMQTFSTFTGWDFDNTWIIYENHTAPLLRVFMTPLTVTAHDFAKTYDGQVYSGGNGVTYSNTPDARLLGSLSYSGTSQGAANAGSYAITPDGLYSNQQGYAIDFVSGELTVNPRTVNLSGSRVYDGSTDVAADIFSLDNLVAGETLSLSGSGSVTGKNVGTQSVSLGTLALEDDSGLASNYTLAGGTFTASITPATLTYTAKPSVQVASLTPSGLTGSIVGFVGDDTLANATNGEVHWTTLADINSLPGSYDITGSGLSAQNYVFANAPGNEAALTLVSQLPLEQLASVISPESLHGPDPFIKSVDPDNPNVNRAYFSGTGSNSGLFLTIEGGGVSLPE